MGIPVEHPFAERVGGVFDGMTNNDREKWIENEKPIQLDPSEQAPLTEAKAKTLEFLRAKILGLGIPADKLDAVMARFNSVPEVRYVEPLVGGQEGIAAYYNPRLNLIGVAVDRKQEDMLTVAMNTAHELSHAVSGAETRAYWDAHNSSPIPDLKGIVAMVGTESVNGKREKIGGAVDNGLAIMDTVDIYNHALKDMFPKEHARRVKAKNALATRIGWNKTFKPLTDDEKTPFVQHHKLPIPIIGKRFPFAHTQLSGFRYQFIKELCRTVGYSNLSDAEKKNVGSVDLVSRGRNILDKSRYLRDNSGLRAIVDAFGPEAAKTIFSADDHDGNLEAAIKKIEARQLELKLV